jgi:hypothetical protein
MFEDRILLSPVIEVCRSDLSTFTIRIQLWNCDDSICVFVWQAPQYNAVHDAEDSCAGTDSEGQGDNDDRSKPWVFN